jgi:hypothetical protein
MPSGEFNYTKKIPNSQIKQIWQKEYPGKRMPKVEGYVLPGSDFRRTVQSFRKDNRKAEQKEYGRNLPLNKTVGAVFHDPSSKSFVIIRHERAAGPVSRTIRHELRHIAKGEVSR